MNRRRYLALCGLGISGVAGCIAGNSRRETTTAPAYDLDIEFSGLQSGVVTLFEDAYELHTESGSQYLFLDVTVASEQRPAVADLEFRFDGGTHPPKTEWDYPPLHRSEKTDRGYPDSTGDMRYRSDEDRDGWVVFELPDQGDASQAALSWPGGEWTPDESVRARLANPLPEFGLDAWRVPATISGASNPEFEISVRNDGAQPGQFWGAIDGDGWTTDRIVSLVSHRIQPGATQSWRVTGSSSQIPPEDMVSDSEEATLSYTLLWEGGSRSQSARVTYE